MRSDVPPKNWENSALTPHIWANAGMIATIAEKIEPGNVILDMIESR